MDEAAANYRRIGVININRFFTHADGYPEIALDHMSGLSSIRACLSELGEEADDAQVRALLVRVKQVGQTGRTVDLHELSLLVKALRHPAPVAAMESIP